MALSPRMALASLMALGGFGCEFVHGPTATKPEPQDQIVVLPPPAAPDVPLEIRQVAVSPKTWIIGSEEAITLTFTLRESSRIRAEIYDEGQALVHVVAGGSRDAGAGELRWPGDGPDGHLLPPGVYLYRLVARTEDGRELASHNPPFGDADEVLAQRFTFDPKGGPITFVLPQAARVRLRAGLRDYPLLATYMDWVPLEAGRHELDWDGHDPTGQVRIREHPEARLNVTAYALPPNAIIVSDAGRSGGFPKGGRRVGVNPAARFLHARHDPAACHEPDFEVSFPGADSRGGLPVLNGRAPVRVAIAPRDYAHLINQRFEVMFFVDNQFIFEREDGISPFTYALDVGSLSPGVHLLTVNVIAYDDHIGVRSVRFIREET